VIWGSQLILKYIERFPAIVYLGSGVLAWTAVKMMSGEPLLANVLAQYPAITWIAYGTVIGGVLIAGFLVNHREVRKRIAAHVVRVYTSSTLPRKWPYGSASGVAAWFAGGLGHLRRSSRPPVPEARPPRPAAF
jgi:Flp pilus assembly protein protease CpaA